MDGFENARRIIEESERHRPRFVCCAGATGSVVGPTGPTD